MLDNSKFRLTDVQRLEILIDLLEEKGLLTREEVLEWLQKTVKKKTPTETSDKDEWVRLMQELDARMPRNVEDIYDALVTNGIPLENFPPIVQEAYKAKKAARKNKPF